MEIFQTISEKSLKSKTFRWYGFITSAHCSSPSTGAESYDGFKKAPVLLHMERELSSKGKKEWERQKLQKGTLGCLV